MQGSTQIYKTPLNRFVTVGQSVRAVFDRTYGRVLRDDCVDIAAPQRQRQHAAAVKSWNPADKPDWLTEEVFREQIQPRLTALAVRAISSALGVSEPYASLIRSKRYLPHPRHWLGLAKLANVIGKG